MINIDTPPMAKGYERDVYIHPEDPGKIIKVTRPSMHNIQTKREISYYKKLKKRKKLNWNHLPKYYGEILQID